MNYLRAIPWAALVVAAACSSTPNTEVGVGSGMSASAGASSGSSGPGNGSTSGNVGTGASGDTGEGSGTSVGSGVASGAVSTGATGGGGSGASSGVGGTTGSTSGVGSAGASAGATSGAGGTGAASGGGSGAASSGAIAGNGRHGMSPGCGMAPAGANSNNFINHKLPIPECTGCTATAGNCTRDCIAPEFAPGGVSDQEAGGESFTNRDFSIELPKNYSTTTPYPVFMGGGGCGGGPPQNGSGYGINETGAIQIGLGYLVRCFADGGSACSGQQKLEPLCVNGPEIPYVRAVLKWVESNFCVDLSKEFIGGGSSGGWEAMTAGCGDADQLRGFISVSGGKREHQWPCMGPMAALMVVNGLDTANPIGQPDQPNVAFNTDLDSYGSAHERLDLLTRNGCVGTATTMYDPAYPDCAKYTGCPADFPVIWCDIPTGGHDNTRDGNTDYTNAMWPFLSSLPSEP
jgi:poly(3-hydroxybutyrate) depolymerase